MKQKVLFINNVSSADDRLSWSGTSFQLIQALRHSGFVVDYLYALKDSSPSIIGKIVFSYWKMVKDLLHKNVRLDDSFYLKHEYGKTLRRYNYSNYDFIFVPAHTCIVSALPQNINAKVIFITDAVVDCLFNYYTEFSNLVWHNYIEAHILCKRAFLRADHLIVSSDWCKNSAIKKYGIKVSNISVVEFGANIDTKDMPILPDGRKILNSKVKIYWSGVNWIRKGGNIALDCCEELIRLGYDVEFTITGLRKLPKECFDVNGHIKSYIHSYGFLNKNDIQDYKTLIKVMNNQNLFLFPSKAECSSIALCEANGFGMPCFVYETGGIGNYVKNGVNGYRLPIEAKGLDFAKKIDECFRHNEMLKLSSGALQMYKEYLNWDVWGQKVKEIVTAL